MFLLHEMAYQNASFLISEGPKFALFLHINTLLVHDAMKYIKYDLDVIFSDRTANAHIVENETHPK